MSGRCLNRCIHIRVTCVVSDSRRTHNPSLPHANLTVGIIAAIDAAILHSRLSQSRATHGGAR